MWGLALVLGFERPRAAIFDLVVGNRDRFDPGGGFVNLENIDIVGAGIFNAVTGTASSGRAARGGDGR